MFPVPAAAQVQGEVELWTLSANLRESFTDNIFLSGLAPQNEYITAATLSLSYNRLRRDSSFGAFAWANGQLFGRLDGYNQGQYGLGVSGRKDFNRRFKLRYNGSFNDGINLEGLYGGGPAQPQVDVKSGTLSFGTTYALTPGTSWSTSVDGTYIRYRSLFPFDPAALPFDPAAPPDVTDATLPQPIDPDDLVLPEGVEILRLLSGESFLAQRLDYGAWRGGSGFTHSFSTKTRGNVDFGYRSTQQWPRAFNSFGQFEASLGFARVLDTKSNLNGGYAFQTSSYGQRALTHSLTLQADREFSKRWRGDVTMGASYFDGTVPGSSGWTWVGGVGGSLRFDRSNLAGRYTRTVYQGQIVPSLQISDTFSLGGGHVFTKRIFASAFGYYRTSEDAVDPRLSYDTAYVAASLSIRLSKRFNTGLSYNFQHFERGAFPSADRSFLSLSLGYSKSWK